MKLISTMIMGFLFLIPILQSNLSYADTCYGCNPPALNSTDLQQAQEKMIQEQERLKQEQQNNVIIISIALLAIGAVAASAFFIRKKIRSKSGLK